MFDLDRYRFADPRNAYATHQPVLWEVAMRGEGPMLEFGCGTGSTPMLHHISSRLGVPLLTLDNDRSWLERYERSMASALHRFESVDDWQETLDHFPAGERYGLVFVDQSPWEARAATVRRFRLEAEYVIVHDCDYLPANGLLGRSLHELNGPRDLGEREYDDVFSAWVEYFPPEPWPLHSGPPTLLGSNFHACDLDVDYERHYGSRALRLLAAASGRLARLSAFSALATIRA